MKKICTCMIVLLLLITGCASKQVEESSNSEPPETIELGGYTVPDYEVYKLSSEENKLGDTKVMLKGKMSDIKESDGLIIGTLHADEGGWLSAIGDPLLHDYSMIQGILEGKEVGCLGTYAGFSGTMELPAVAADTFLCEGNAYYAPIIFLSEPYSSEIGDILDRAQTGEAPEATDSEPEDESIVAEESEVTESSEETLYYSSGTYKVGSDIAAGEYVIVNASASYMEVTSDSSGDLSAIVMNDFFTNRLYVTVSEGQYITFKGKMYAEADTPAYVPINGIYGEGMYKVGKDIPAGEYKISPTEDRGYFEVCSDSFGTLHSILTNDNIQNEVYQSLSEGQYIKLQSCQIIS